MNIDQLVALIKTLEALETAGQGIMRVMEREQMHTRSTAETFIPFKNRIYAIKAELEALIDPTPPQE